MGKISCAECTSFRCALRKQVDAFKVLASVNDKLSSSILLHNLDELLKSVEEKEDEVEAPSTLDNEASNSMGNSNDAEKTIEDDQKADGIDKPRLYWKRRGKRGWKGWEKKCRFIVEKLWSHEDAEPFRHPIDMVEFSDYNRIIEKPVCLEMIKELLERRQYKNPTDFHGDIMLIFHNSKTYNINRKSEIRRMTHRLEEFYSNQQQELLMDLESRLKSKKSRQTEIKQINVEKSSTLEELRKIVKRGHCRYLEKPSVPERQTTRNRRNFSCPKCPEKVQSYDILAIHMSKCKGQGLDNIQAKMKQSMRVIKKSPKVIDIKLKVKKKLKQLQQNQKKQKKEKITKINGHKWSRKQKQPKNKVTGIVVRNPFRGFNLQQALGVRVRLEPLRLRMSFVSPHSGSRPTGLQIVNPKILKDDIRLVNYTQNESVITPNCDRDDPMLSQANITADNSMLIGQSQDIMDDPSENLSAMILHKLENRDSQVGSPTEMKMTQELDWSDIESKNYYNGFDEFMSSNQNYYTTLLPVQNDWDSDFGSNLIPLTPITMTNCNEYVSHSFL